MHGRPPLSEWSTLSRWEWGRREKKKREEKLNTVCKINEINVNKKQKEKLKIKKNESEGSLEKSQHACSRAQIQAAEKNL